MKITKRTRTKLRNKLIVLKISEIKRTLKLLLLKGKTKLTRKLQTLLNTWWKKELQKQISCSVKKYGKCLMKIPDSNCCLMKLHCLPEELILTKFYCSVNAVKIMLSWSSAWRHLAYKESTQPKHWSDCMDAEAELSLLSIHVRGIHFLTLQLINWMLQNSCKFNGTIIYEVFEQKQIWFNAEHKLSDLSAMKWTQAKDLPWSILT